MIDFYSLLDSTDGHGQVAELACHPDDVLADARLTLGEKRALLASWASDANAVPNAPSLRQLPGASVVKVSEILAALKALDGSGDSNAVPSSGAHPWQRTFKRRRIGRFGNGKWHGRRSDDDDDPPPCPAYIVRQPRGGGGAAFAAEVVPA